MSSEGWSRMPEIGPGIKALANGRPPQTAISLQLLPDYQPNHHR